MFELVNSGSRANTDTADTIREAFHKINNNFLAISSSGGGGGGGTSLTTGSTYPITSSWSVSSSYLGNIAQDFIPYTSSTYSLGSATKKWKDLFVSTGSIYIGDTSLTSDGSTLKINSQPVVTYNTASSQIEVIGLNKSLTSYGNVLMNNLYDNILLYYERKSEQLVEILPNDYGTQADGQVTISSLKNINTDTLANGRTVADGISYVVTAITSSTTTSTITISGSSVTGISSGDEMLLINVQGDINYNTNIGNYEFLKVLSVSSNKITFNSPLTRYYGEPDNSVIGNQKVILQRVPNYSTVTVTNTGTLTSNSWNGAMGGIVAFRCNTLINSGSIHTNGKGFRYGVGGINDPTQGCTQSPTPAPAGDRAESIEGLDSVLFCNRLGRNAIINIRNGGGGGGGVNLNDTTTNRSGGGGGGGANLTNGINGSNSSYGLNIGGNGGVACASSSILLFGGGGGGGGRAINGLGGNGGNGGGIIIIYSNNFNNTSLINSTGSNGSNGTAGDDGGGGGGGGAGGSVLIKSNYVNALGSLSVNSGSGGAGAVGQVIAGASYGSGGNGGAGGLGYQLLKYTSANVSVSSVSSSYEPSNVTTTTGVDPNIEDGYIDNFYAYNTVSSVVSASWENIYKYYYNTTGSVNSITSYPIRTISSSIKYPTVVRTVVFAENNDTDPWIINNDLKLYLSNDEGVSYTTVNLTKRGMYETGKFIYSNDVNIVPQNTASLTYKLEFSSSKVINVYGIGLIWSPDLTVISSSISSSYAVTSSYALNSNNNALVSRTVSFSPTSSNVILTGVGYQSDLDNASVTFTGGNTLNVFNIGNLKLTQLTHFIASGVNPTSAYYLYYPEPTGQTNITSSQFPFPTHFNNSYGNAGINTWTISNSNATMSCQKTGLTLGSQITVKVVF